MERFDAACLTDAKKEYTQRFVRKLKTPFSGKILELFKESQEECANSHQDEKVLFTFQEKLEKIPEWDDVTIEQFSRSMIGQSKCDYLEELLQGVFIIHTKILAVIQHHKSSTKSELKLPTIEDFVFQAFINTGREVWKYAYLFTESNDSCVYQKNTNIFEKKIESCILETIEDMLPVRELLLEHVKEYVDDDDDDDEPRLQNKLPKRIRGGMSLYNDEYEDSERLGEDSSDFSITPTLDSETPQPPSVPPTPAPTPISTPPSSPLPSVLPPTPPAPEVSEQISSVPPPVEIKNIELPISDNSMGGAPANILDSYSGEIVSMDANEEKKITFDDPVPSANLTTGSDNMDKLSALSYSQL
tara:strand:+ start:2245 stop:3321 length:1077 start_codon:yes stop_codon:yes gene_type:complete